MSCINDELIQKYIDNELIETEKQLVEKHLFNCENCRNKLEHQNKLSTKIKESIDLLVDLNFPIPSVEVSELKTKRHFISKKQIIYSLSAACLLFFVVFFISKQKTNTNHELIIVNSFEGEYDANLPVTQQDMVFKVIDSEGNITEF